jgi:hypothetical protein
MTTPNHDYKRRDSPNDPNTAIGVVQPNLDGVANKQNYTFNYGVNTTRAAPQHVLYR